jgi:hypothetical protein
VIVCASSVVVGLTSTRNNILWIDFYRFHVIGLFYQRPRFTEPDERTVPMIVNLDFNSTDEDDDVKRKCLFVM